MYVVSVQINSVLTNAVNRGRHYWEHYWNLAMPDVWDRPPRSHVFERRRWRSNTCEGVREDALLEFRWRLPRRRRRRLLSPVHTSNNVEATGNFVAKNDNNVERVYRKISSFRQSRMLLRHCCRFFNLFRLCRKDEISFDIVAKTGSNVEATFDFVERIVRLVAFDSVVSTLLLVWTGL